MIEIIKYLVDSAFEIKIKMVKLFRENKAAQGVWTRKEVNSEELLG